MDEKDQIIQKLLEEIALLKQIVAQQAARILELEKRLNKNSGNSSKPPSSDGLSKPPRTTSLRAKGKHKSGGQVGHKGETLNQTENPDKIAIHKILSCPTCSKSLKTSPLLDVSKRQVFDIPEIKLEVTEHQAEIKLCRCCNKRVTAAFPKNIKAPVQYGDKLQSWAVYFQHQQLIPEDRVQAIFCDLLSIKLATATLNRISESVYETLADFEQKVLLKVKNAPVKHLDETGFRVTGKTQWLHVASTIDLTYYHISARRKSLLTGLSGIVVHDHWKSYYRLKEVLHGLCNQHHLRELRALIEYDKESWARKMHRFLRFGAHYRNEHENPAIPEGMLNRLGSLYDKIVAEGLSYHEQLPIFSEKKGRGRRARRTGHNLVLRLKNYRDDVLRFLVNPSVPFTNNQAEQDIRMMKCKQKISGGFRTARGADVFIRIRGFISTARKQVGIFLNQFNR